MKLYNCTRMNGQNPTLIAENNCVGVSGRSISRCRSFSHPNFHMMSESLKCRQRRNQVGKISGEGHGLRETRTNSLVFQATYLLERMTVRVPTWYIFLVLRLRSETKIRLDSAETREQFLCLFIVDRGMNDNIVPLLPRLATDLNKGNTFQSMGVTRLCLSVNCKESMTRRTSVELRPVLAG
jgi:hypothetical protein